MQRIPNDRQEICSALTPLSRCWQLPAAGTKHIIDAIRLFDSAIASLKIVKDYSGVAALLNEHDLPLRSFQRVIQSRYFAYGYGVGKSFRCD